MATFRKFEDIDAWQKARELVKEVYGATGRGSFSKDFALKDQIRRASISAMSNIAEGFERDGKKEFIQLLSIAKGSTGEVKSQLYVAKDQGYLTRAQFDSLAALADKTGRMIAGLMGYLKESNIRGWKFS